MENEKWNLVSKLDQVVRTYVEHGANRCEELVKKTLTQEDVNVLKDVYEIADHFVEKVKIGQKEDLGTKIHIEDNSENNIEFDFGDEETETTDTCTCNHCTCKNKTSEIETKKELIRDILDGKRLDGLDQETMRTILDYLKKNEDNYSVRIVNDSMIVDFY